MAHSSRRRRRGRAGAAALGAAALALVTLSPDPARAQAPVSASYDIYLGGLHLAVADANVALSNGRYSLALVSGLRGLSGMFSSWRAEISAHGSVNGASVSPQGHRFLQMRRNRAEAVEMQFNSTGVDGTTFTPARDRPEPGHPDHIPDSDLQGAVDPASGLVTIMHMMDQAETCNAIVPVYDGRRRFDLVFAPIAVETLEPSRYSAFSGQATRCRVHLEFMSGAFRSDGFWSRGSARTDRQMDVWFARPYIGGPVLPVRMQGDTRFGPFLVHLTAVRPVGQ